VAEDVSQPTRLPAVDSRSSSQGRFLLPATTCTAPPSPAQISPPAHARRATAGHVDYSIVAICGGRVQIVPGVSLDKSAADRDARKHGMRLVRPQDVVIHEPSIQVQIDYPLRRSTVVTLHGDVPGGFTRRHLLESLQAEYSRIYAEEESVAPPPDAIGQALAEGKGCALGNRWVLCMHRGVHEGQAYSASALMLLQHALLAMPLASIKRQQGAGWPTPKGTDAIPCVFRSPTLRRPTTNGPWGIWGHHQHGLFLCDMKKLGAEGPWVLFIDT